MGQNIYLRIFLILFSGHLASIQQITLADAHHVAAFKYLLFKFPGLTYSPLIHLCQ